MYDPTPPAVTGTPPMIDPFPAFDFGPLLADPFRAALDEAGRRQDEWFRDLAGRATAALDAVGAAAWEALDRHAAGWRAALDRALADDRARYDAIRDCNTLTPAADW